MSQFEGTPRCGHVSEETGTKCGFPAAYHHKDNEKGPDGGENHEFVADKGE